ncbi:MAG: N-acetyltransferase [Spirochaetales bacterium]|nr:N-acetyltransferase [Spirochaetales bacterium]
MEYTVDTMKRDDWERVRSIYLEGIAGGNSTFENDAPDWNTWHRDHLREPRLVARAMDTVIAWAALTPVSRRRVYAGVAELSLYVASKHRGRGIGSALLAALIDASEVSGIWTLQGVIFPENTASLGLFRKQGFREVGRRERLGKMTHGEYAGRWRDVVLLERRSSRVGIE